LKFGENISGRRLAAEKQKEQENSQREKKTLDTKLTESLTRVVLKWLIEADED
jgi:hypothetical protein